MDEFQSEKRPDIAALGHYPKQETVTGTTLVAIEYDGGVVVGVDSRTSAGNFVASRATDKITPITDTLAVLRCGSTADTQAIADIVKYNLEAFSVMEGAPLSVYRSAQIFRKYFYNYREQLSGAVIVVGYDEEKNGQVYTIASGGMVSRQNFTAQGSGSAWLMTYMDLNWRPNMSLDEVKELVRTSVNLAIYRDGSSGGVIRLAVIDKTGMHREQYRADRNEHISFPKPKIYSTFPPHIITHPAQ